MVLLVFSDRLIVGDSHIDTSQIPKHKISQQYSCCKNTYITYHPKIASHTVRKGSLKYGLVVYCILFGWSMDIDPWNPMDMWYDSYFWMVDLSAPSFTQHCIAPRTPRFSKKFGTQVGPHETHYPRSHGDLVVKTLGPSIPKINLK